jgi:hypothetical protein
MYGLNSGVSEYGPVENICEHGREPESWIKMGNFLSSRVNINCSRKIMHHEVTILTVQ